MPFERVGKGVLRVDAGPLTSLEKPRRTPAGYLEVDAYFSRTGIYEYPQPDGSIRREMRLDSEVFAEDSLAAFRGVPVTKEHPPGLLTPATARTYSRGAVATKAWKADGERVAGTLVIHDDELAGEVESGVRDEISPGYLCDVEDAPPGTRVDGKEIHGYQRNIIPNHVAVVKAARGGDQIRVRLDGQSQAVQDVNAPTATTGAGDQMAARKITIEGISGEVPDHVAEAWERHDRLRTDSAGEAQRRIDAATKGVEAATKDAAEQRARADSAVADLVKAQAECARLDADLKAAKSPAAVAEVVKARTTLAGHAVLLVGAKAVRKLNLDGIGDDELRAVVLERRVGLKLDSIPEAQRGMYLRTRFDEEVTREQARLKRLDEDGDQDGPPHATSDAGDDPADDDDDDDDGERKDGPAPFTSPSMDRRDSREPARDPAPGRVRLDRHPEGGRRQDPKLRHDEFLYDVGRSPLPSPRTGNKQ